MRCAEGSYNFKAGSTCNTCPSTGAICRGGFNGSVGVSAKRNYYGYIAPESNDYDLSIFLCPANQCCQHESCVVNGTDECAPTRDPATPLCGSCDGTLSETLGSVECKQCSSNNWLLIILYLMVYCAIGCYLLYTLKSTVKTAVADSQTIITKCLAYCYQTIPLLVQADSVTVVLQPLLSIFALKTSNGDSGGMCFVQGMDAMGKLLVPLVGPMFLVAVVFVLLSVAILRARLAQAQEATDEQDSDEG